MTRVVRSGTLSRMERYWILEMDGEAGPIRGSVRDSEGRELRFSSWIALLAALQELRDAGQVRRAPASSRRPETPSLR